MHATLSFPWRTADDGTALVGHGLLVTSALRCSGMPVELHVFPHGCLGLGLADGSNSVGSSPKVARWTGLCERRLVNLGF